jgi:hypothetical protein
MYQGSREGNFDSCWFHDETTGRMDISSGTEMTSNHKYILWLNYCLEINNFKHSDYKKLQIIFDKFNVYKICT